MRRFYLNRLEDETGISGTGRVTEGYQYLSNGICVMRWLTDTTSVAFYENIDHVLTIHGHGGKTVVEWEDATFNLRDAPLWTFDPISYLKQEILNNE